MIKMPKGMMCLNNRLVLADHRHAVVSAQDVDGNKYKEKEKD